jgi:hypothetical protein
MQEANINLPLVVVQQSVVERNFGDSTGLAYAAAIRNDGASGIDHNLNI